MSAGFQFSHLELRVLNLARSVAFYENQIGFFVISRDDSGAKLAAGEGEETILTLIAAPGATSPARNAAGLFHSALLFSDRVQLGHWLRRAAQMEIRFEGFSDHGVSEALYFSDPDGNGLEFYADRPRHAWPRTADGTLQMFTAPLDVPSLLAAGDTDTSTNPLAGARWGHLHLSVADLARSAKFYQEFLGLDEVARYGDSARFLAGEGYHHHVGLNNWARATQPQAENGLGLVRASFVRPGAIPATTRDPDHLEIAIRGA